VKLDVLHLDNHLVVVNKPTGVPTVPDESQDVSLFDAVREHVERTFAKPGRAFIGVVHRLDRPVSGVVCFARTSKAAARLGAAFKEHLAHKTYLGIADGVPRERGGEVLQWIAKDERTGRIVATRDESPGSKRAHTRWRVVATAPFEGRGVALLELVPTTGRSHQLRLAAQSLGTPLLGDLRHGARAALADRSVALHAARLEVEHPTLRTPSLFEAQPPDTAWWRVFESERR
jgi:23S rRNA pseudouridine1911/1915/1917 synthase